MRSVPTIERDPADGKVTYRSGQEEHPYRALAVLTNIARGHALVHGRRHVDETDLPTIARVTVSSMPDEASTILKALISEGGRLTVAQVQKVLGVKSPGTARSRMGYMDTLRPFNFIEEGVGKTARLEFEPDFEWCASKDFRDFLQDNRTPVARHGRSPKPVKNVQVCPERLPVKNRGTSRPPLTASSPEHSRKKGGKKGFEHGRRTHTPRKMAGSAEPRSNKEGKGLDSESAKPKDAA